FSNKGDLINLNKVVWNSKLAQNLILEKSIGNKYWNTILPFAKTSEITLSNVYSFPKRIALFPGVSCMFYCGFCGRNQSQKYPMNIIDDSLKNFEQLFAEVPNTSALSISGGLEPLTNPSIGKIITLANQNNIRVPLITNGYSLTENFLKKNPGIWELDSLRISLYGVDKESYSFITTIEKSFEIVKRNTINFLKLRNEINKNLKFGFNFIIIPENTNQLVKILDLIKEINDDVPNGRGVDFLTLRDDYQSVTGNSEDTDIDRKYRLNSKMDENLRNILIEKIDEFKLKKNKLCPELFVDFGYSLEALSKKQFDKELLKVSSKDMREYGFTQMSVAIDLFGDVFLFREAGFLNRKGNEKFIIGRLNKENNLENIIQSFLKKQNPIKYENEDERFMDSFDHVLTLLVNQAQKDKEFDIPFKLGPIKERYENKDINLGNNWYSESSQN
ncbi:hypothetical protein OAM09_04300, partial [Candidatus Pelagibacter sp.]|nr:hypothetical protein [Candidatus Pelagibacter sp.]